LLIRLEYFSSQVGSLYMLGQCDLYQVSMIYVKMNSMFVRRQPPGIYASLPTVYTSLLFSLILPYSPLFVIVYL
jgi:hypothetical protein